MSIRFFTYITIPNIYNLPFHYFLNKKHYLCKSILSSSKPTLLRSAYLFNDQLPHSVFLYSEFTSTTPYIATAYTFRGLLRYMIIITLPIPLYKKLT